MYYYGCNSGYTPYAGVNTGYGYQSNYNGAIVLVLFILLVIILGARAFGPGTNN